MKNLNITNCLKTHLLTCILYIIIAISTVTYTLLQLKSFIPISSIILYLTPLLVYSLLIGITYIYRLIQIKTLSKELELNKQYTKTLESLHSNVRCFKHDFNNMIQSINGYIALNDMIGLKAYFSQLKYDCQITNNYESICNSFFKNPSLCGILADKLYIATKNNIKMNFTILTNISTIKDNIYEISKIVGILLDNSIEASLETSEKNVDITISSDNLKHTLTISNTFIDKKIPIDKIYEKGFSTKKNNSGIGLWEVHKILEKNSKLDLYTKTTDNIFIQQFDIYY